MAARIRQRLAPLDAVRPRLVLAPAQAPRHEHHHQPLHVGRDVVVVPGPERLVVPVARPLVGGPLERALHDVDEAGLLHQGPVRLGQLEGAAEADGAVEELVVEVPEVVRLGQGAVVGLHGEAEILHLEVAPGLEGSVGGSEWGVRWGGEKVGEGEG